MREAFCRDISDDSSEISCLPLGFFFSRRLFFLRIHLLRDVVDEDAADDVEGEAARGVDAGDGDVVVLVAEDGGVGVTRDPDKALDFALHCMA